MAASFDDRMSERVWKLNGLLAILVIILGLFMPMTLAPPFTYVVAVVMASAVITDLTAICVVSEVRKRLLAILLLLLYVALCLPPFGSPLELSSGCSL